MVQFGFSRGGGGGRTVTEPLGRSLTGASLVLPTVFLSNRTPGTLWFQIIVRWRRANNIRLDFFINERFFFVRSF